MALLFLKCRMRLMYSVFDSSVLQFHHKKKSVFSIFVYLYNAETSMNKKKSMEDDIMLMLKSHECLFVCILHTILDLFT